MTSSEVQIPLKGVVLEGELHMGELGIVLFAHGSGSSRHSPRNQFVARQLRESGLGTLLFDLLTRSEEDEEAETRHLRFDIPFLAERLALVTRWLLAEPEAKDTKLGYFGASTGAAAALVAAAEMKDSIAAVVSRGGRPDLAGEALCQVQAPTLLLVGSEDAPVIQLNEEAFARLRCQKELQIIRGATHLFEEPGTLEIVARMAAEWFAKHLLRTTGAVPNFEP
jgi:putative phosphoribosyl transferase